MGRRRRGGEREGVESGELERRSGARRYEDEAKTRETRGTVGSGNPLSKGKTWDHLTVNIEQGEQ